MGIFAMPFMAWGHTLQIIPNKRYWHASCKDGAPSMNFFHWMDGLLIIHRCLAQPHNMDGLPIIPRTQEHTNEVAARLELGAAWEEYGMIGDIVVRITVMYLPSYA
jgi:hypothetical protein